MENKTENYAYCKTLSLEEALKERNSCLDDNGNIINNKKLSFLMENTEFVKFLFSEENLINNASQDRDLSLKAAGEAFLNKAYPPHWYWQMPDYYYPGLYSEIYAVKDSPWCWDSSDRAKLSLSITRNEAVLNDCGWKKKEYDSCEYFNPDFPNIKLVFNKDSESISFVSIDSESQKELAHFDIPFYLICGIFLKCREMDFKKPWQLRAHDFGETSPDVFERKHHIVRDPETHEIIDYGDWKPEKE